MLLHMAEPMRDIFDFLFEPTFSFGDLTRLTGVRPKNIHALIRRGHFEPQVKPRLGAGGSREAKTYAGSEVLWLALIARLVHYRLADAAFLAKAYQALESSIKAFIRSKGRWRKFPPYSVDKRVVPKDNSKKPLFTVVKWTPTGYSFGSSRNPGKAFRPGGPWCLVLVLDLHRQVERECIRMAEYSRQVCAGVNRDKALRGVDKRLAKSGSLWLGYLLAMDNG
jgi:hypothetical protein